VFPEQSHSAEPLSPAGWLRKALPGSDRTGVGDWATSQLQPIDTRQDSIRGDITINDKTNLMVRYINEKWTHLGASGNFWGMLLTPLSRLTGVSQAIASQ
jgi:hypothetical protein